MTSDHNTQPDLQDDGRPILEATVVDHPDTLDVHIHVTDATGDQTLTAAASIASAVLTHVVDDLFPQMDNDADRAQFFLGVYGRLTMEMTNDVREHLMDNYPGVVTEMETPDDDTEAHQ